jgi:indolepyruvate ferredoxin oxidoreductase beta subunit
MSAPSTARPTTLLIAALGGEGGGVLTHWIVNAAQEAGLVVQSTSIPGVAQRTGATTYYVEIYPVPRAALKGAVPVLALNPGPGDVDLVVSSELLEAGRAIANGFVTRDRTTLIASTHRVYAISERMGMGDGRFDMGRVFKSVEENARLALLFDMEEAARDAGAPINAVMLGAIAGAHALPVPVEAFEASVRAEGKSVESNLRGFRAGLALVAKASSKPGIAQPTKRAERRSLSAEDLLRRVDAELPEAARDLVREGVNRLVRYQSLAYARTYLDRLVPIVELDRKLGANGKLAREVGRHLAVRMSYEDIIRVAQAKADPKRLARIAAEAGVKPGQPVKVVDFFKPGFEELCSILPPALARAILRLAERRGWLNRVYWGMHVETSSITGFGRVWLLAELRPWRPLTYRYHEEQAAIENWLDLVRLAGAKSLDLALEVAECARLIKGYGDTFRRGVWNYHAIESRVILPALAGRLASGFAADGIASARTAALADPEGKSLDRSLEEIERRAGVPAAAQ